jgi:hypothetical protein
VATAVQRNEGKKDEGGPKQKLTAITNKKDFTIRSYTSAEVKEEFGRKN